VSIGQIDDTGLRLLEPAGDAAERRALAGVRCDHQHAAELREGVVREVRAADVASPKDAGTREIAYQTLVRARVTDAKGKRAWTRAYRVGE
jgi:hypothetical protein